MTAAGEKFDRLVQLMERLRGPDGCPWDREQCFDSIKPYTLEETYEVLDAIDRRDWKHLSEELGDFLLQAVFYAQMAREAGHFSIADSLDAINEKLVRRHPHVFGGGDAKTPDAVKARWDEIKAAERKDHAAGGLLSGIPRALPALQEAAQISARAAGAGFDWPDIGGVFAKVHEELGEVERAASPEDREGEIGDLLFTIVNLARFLKVDPEQALRKANARFRTRFAHVERGVAASGRELKDAPLAELESFWQEAKRTP